MQPVASRARRMFRIAATTLVVLVACVGLAACGDDIEDRAAGVSAATTVAGEGLTMRERFLSQADIEGVADMVGATDETQRLIASLPTEFLIEEEVEYPVTRTTTVSGPVPLPEVDYLPADARDAFLGGLQTEYALVLRFATQDAALALARFEAEENADNPDVMTYVGNLAGSPGGSYREYSEGEEIHAGFVDQGFTYGLEIYSSDPETTRAAISIIARRWYDRVRGEPHRD